MNRRAFVVGVVTIFAANLVAVALRAFAEAAFLADYGARALPLLLVGQAVAFAVGTTVYHAATARAPLPRVDIALGVALIGGAAAAAPLVARGRPWPFVIALAVVALSSVVNLALWNTVAAAVAGRDARRWLPRAGAAVTAGGALAGLGAAALIRRAGADPVPWAAAGVAVIVVGLLIATQRALAAGGAPGATAPPGTSATAMGGDHRALLRWLAVAAVLEAAVATALEFRFGAAMKQRFTGAELASAISLFYGGTHLLLLVLQVAVVPQLLTSRRLPVTLSIHPLLSGLGALALAAAPGFVAIAAVRTGDWVLRAATSRTGQEISLSALPPVPRARWKVLLRGAATPLGAAAAGGVLAVLGARALASPVGFAVAVATTIAVWLWVVQQAATRFLAALAAPLGMKSVALAGRRRDGFDLDTMTRLVAATGASDPGTAALAHAALARAGGAADEITAHLADDDPAVRRALYHLAARRPRPAAARELRAAALIDDDPAALAAAVRALAAHGAADAIAAVAARGVDDPAVDRALDAARAQLGGDGAAGREAAVAALVAHDGEWAAELGGGDGGRYDAAVAAALAAGGTARREGLRAATGGGEASLTALLAALTAGDRDAITAVADLDDDGVRALRARLPAIDAAGRAAIARARAAGPAPGVLLASLAEDDDDDVRAAALRSLAGHARAGQIPTAELAARAVERERRVLAALTAARAAGAPALHAAEVDRAVRRALDRLLMAVALATAAGGRPAAPLLAAGRRLVDAPEAARRRALDVIQELAVAPPPVLDAIERALRPPGPADAAARAALAAVDPWLARLLAGELADREPALAALRACPFFAALPGHHADQLAGDAARRTLEPGEALCTAGEPGEAMYALTSGELAVELDGAAHLGPGAIVGELALIDDAPRAATVRAVTASEVLVFERAAFQTALLRWPDLGLALLKTLALRTRGR